MSDFGKLVFDTDVLLGRQEEARDRFDAHDDAFLDDDFPSFGENLRLFGTYRRPVGWRDDGDPGECD